MSDAEQILVFQGLSRVAQGPLADVTRSLRQQVRQEDSPPYQVFRCSDGYPIDIDMAEGSAAPQQGPGAPCDDAAPVPVQKPRGRPRLGVTGREVTLLPRHWEWLDRQRGGASAALRRLIDADRRQNAGEDRVRQAQDATHRFMFRMAGDLAGFEEAMRALYAGDKAGFVHQIRNWPVDVRDATLDFARDAFAAE